MTEYLIQLAYLAIGFAVLVKGADWFVDGAAALAKKFGIPELVVGLTIVAMGTSLPEAAVSITGVLKGSAGISIGNVIGSNICNILLILGVTATITTLQIQQSTIRYELPFMIFISGILLAMGMSGGMITRMEGGILWGFFVVYLIYLKFLTDNTPEEETAEDEDEDGEPPSIGKCVGLIIVGAAMIIYGSDLAVQGAKTLAQLFGMSDRLIGLTIVAIGTSLPELATSTVAALKGDADIAVGNIVGSNVFNILFVVGTTALIVPVRFAEEFVQDGIIAIGVAVLLWAGIFRSAKAGRPLGITLLILYAAYTAHLLGAF
ncbi:MAG: calcium/sodium antiporter [Selenomonadaceae bacterium]|nr:calcium/sodium antiporter [Selenomonadaceae bacterium]